MNHNTLLNMVSQHRKDFFIYSPNDFAQRVKEEKVRSEFTGTSFLYFEIDFETWVRPQTKDEKKVAVWNCLFDFFAKELRGSDIKGLSSDGRKFCILLVDCETNSTNQVLERMRAHLERSNLNKHISSWNAVKESAFYYESKEDLNENS